MAMAAKAAISAKVARHYKRNPLIIIADRFRYARSIPRVLTAEGGEANNESCQGYIRCNKLLRVQYHPILVPTGWVVARGCASVSCLLGFFVRRYCTVASSDSSI